MTPNGPAIDDENLSEDDWVKKQPSIKNHGGELKA